MDLREVGCDLGDWIDFSQDMDQWRAEVRAVIKLVGSLKASYLVPRLSSLLALK